MLSIFNLITTVPDDWASVAITNPTGENALHGTEYTLLCTVTGVPGMRLHPQWSGWGLMEM